ncbi:OmpA family protein [Thiosocius teredinicola]|uniref:OmpA family protein n=1 Tax=Thiosocius teredinicola TaxID=1973002 RepID=UPI0009914E9D
MACRLGRIIIGLVCCAGLSLPVAAQAPCDALIEQNHAQLEAMQRYAESFQQSLEELSAALAQADRRNAEQTALIERLEAELRKLRARDPTEHDRQRREFFVALRRELPLSTLYEVSPDRLIIASDPVFIFGKGELGAEGQERLSPLMQTFRSLVEQLPKSFPWRIRVEGHSDSRPLRTNPKFDNNWELSVARSVSMLQFMVEQGFPEDRLSAVGLADTHLRDPGDSKAAHRRNRRIEVHLIYEPFPAAE